MCENDPLQSFISSVDMHAIKRLMVNYDTPAQYLNFNQTDFHIHLCSASHDVET